VAGAQRQGLVYRDSEIEPGLDYVMDWWFMPMYVKMRIEGWRANMLGISSKLLTEIIYNI
jgi:hypothetical protein